MVRKSVFSCFWKGKWGMIEMKDYFDFEETEENRLFVYEIHHIGSMNNL